MSEESNELVQADNTDPRTAVADWGFGQLVGKYFTSLDGKAKDASKQMFSLIHTQGKKVDDYLNKEVKIVAYLLTPATFTDESNGEEITTLVTRMRLDTGEVLETHSKGVAKSIMLASQLLGMPSAKVPYRATLKRQSLRGAKSWIVLDFAT